MDRGEVAIRTMLVYKAVTKYVTLFYELLSTIGNSRKLKTEMESAAHVHLNDIKTTLNIQSL